MWRRLVVIAFAFHFCAGNLVAQFPQEIYDPGKLPRWKASFTDTGLHYFEISTLTMAHSNVHADYLKNADLITFLGCSKAAQTSLKELLRSYDDSRKRIFELAKQDGDFERAAKGLEENERRTLAAINEALSPAELQRLSDLILIRRLLDHSLPISDELKLALEENRPDVDLAISQLKSGLDDISQKTAEAELELLEPNQVDRLAELVGDPMTLFESSPEILFLQLDAKVDTRDLGLTPGWLPRPKVYAMDAFGAMKVQVERSEAYVDDFMPIVSLFATVPGVAREVDMVGGQNALGTIFLEASEDVNRIRRAANDLSESEFRSLLDDFGEDINRQIESILLPHQMTVFRRLANQYRAKAYGPVNMMLTETWSKEIDLTAEQTRVLRSKRSQLQQLIKANSQRLEKDAWKLINPLLFPNQDDRTRISDMLDDYYEFESSSVRAGVMLSALLRLKNELKEPRIEDGEN